MAKQRVPETDIYYYFELREDGYWRIEWDIDTRNPIANKLFNDGNYFTSRQEAHECLELIRKVLHGAKVLDQDVIPTDEELQRIALEKYPDFQSTQVFGYVETNLHRTPFLDGMRHLKSIIINAKTV